MLRVYISAHAADTSAAMEKPATIWNTMPRYSASMICALVWINTAPSTLGAAEADASRSNPGGSPSSAIIMPVSFGSLLATSTRTWMTSSLASSVLS